MPRYSSFQVKSAQILQNSPPLNQFSASLAQQNNKNYTALNNDLKISWDGDLKIDPNTGDYTVSYGLEAFTQRIYRKLITQQGNYPGDESFGWNFEYLFSTPIAEQKKFLPYIADNIKSVLEQDQEIASVADVTVKIVRNDYQTHNIVIEIQVIPVGYNSQVNLILESV